MKQIKFEDMTNVELVTRYNDLVIKYKPTNFKTTKRFASKSAAITRISKLMKAIKDDSIKAAIDNKKVEKIPAKTKAKAKAKPEIKPETKIKKSTKAKDKAKTKTKTAIMVAVWEKNVTPKLNITRMEFIKMCEKRKFNRYTAVCVWAKMAKKHNIENPTALANEKAQERKEKSNGKK